MDLNTDSTATALSASSTWAITLPKSELVAVKGARELIDYFYAITLLLNLLCSGKDELRTE